MRRALVLTLIGTAVIVGTPGAASAGAGCHGAPTPERDATGDEDAKVHMVDACFDATITRIDPGAEVTFVNDDSATHNVGGTGWGNYDDMSEGDSYSATFSEPGIYPFACSYHAGMTGAIVVADGAGAGEGAAVATVPTDVERAASRTAGAPSGTPVTWIVVAGLGGAAVGAAAMAVGRRRATTR